MEILFIYSNDICGEHNDIPKPQVFLLLKLKQNLYNEGKFFKKYKEAVENQSFSTADTTLK